MKIVLVSLVVIGVWLSYTLFGAHRNSETAPEGTIKIPILVYHDVRPGDSLKEEDLDVTPQVFEEHARFLKENGFTVVSLDAVLGRLLKNSPLPTRPVVLTFDDARQGQYFYALPILKRYDYPATFFLWTGKIGELGFLTWRQIQELDRAGMTIGGHTNLHLRLTKFNDAAVRSEIKDEKKKLEAILGKEMRFFAYPFGAYDNRVAHLVEETGYLAARSVDGGLFQHKEKRYHLNGFVIHNSVKSLAGFLQQ